MPDSSADLPLEVDVRSPPRWMDGVVLLAVLITLATVGYSLYCRTPLIWDGSYQLAETLRFGKPYAYLSRFHTHVLWLPVVWASHLTDNIRLLQAIYGAPFLLAPVIGLAGSWWLVRKHQPALIVWATLGILATPLPGQIFVINDSIFQQHLFWPVFLGLLVPLQRKQKVFWALLAIFQFVHQVGLILLAGAAVTTLLLALLSREPPDRKRLFRAFVLVALMTLIMGAKVWWISTPGHHYYDSYAAQEASWQTAQERWWKAVKGEPWNGLRLAYIAAIAIALQAWFAYRKWDRLARGASTFAMLLLVYGVLHWTKWSSTPIGWGGAIDYRRWLVPLTMPAFILVFIELVRTARWGIRPVAGTTLVLRSVIVLMLAIVFATVLGRQSTQIDEMTDRLEAEIAASPTTTITIGPDHWLRGTPLDHWAISWESLVLQGKKPAKWVVATDVQPIHMKVLEGETPSLPMGSFATLPPAPGPDGWFDLYDLTKRAAEEWSTGRVQVGPTK